MDSVQKETPAVTATKTLSVEKQNNRPLLLGDRRHRLTEEDLRKALAPGEVAVHPEKIRKRANVTSKNIARIRRVVIGILPYVEMTKLNREAKIRR